MSSVGKIILDNNYPSACVIISDKGRFNRGLILTEIFDSKTCLKLNKEDITKINYRGRKMDNRSVDLAKVTTIYNLNIREIGVLSEEAYCKLLRKFVSYQASIGATDSSYLQVREDVHDQLIKMMNKQ